MNKRDVIIIGGGAGGLSIAQQLAQQGLEISLFERRQHLGGDALHYGCVPSQALQYFARLAHSVHLAKNLGLTDQASEIRTESIMQKIQDKLDRIQPQHPSIEIFHHAPKFINPNQIEANYETYTAKRFVIATGSSQSIPEIPGIDHSGYLTEETLLTLREWPKRLAILGGGTVGVEWAQAFQRLGTQVILIEPHHRVLKHYDRFQSDLLERQLESEGVMLYCGYELSSIKKNQDGCVCQLSSVNQEHIQELQVDTILLATERKPNISGIGLDAADIATVAQGIPVDRRLRTSQKHIYAVGDVVASRDKLSYVAEYHAKVAAKNIAYRWPQYVNDLAIPRVAFTDPEIARVGFTEEQLREKQISYEMVEYPYAQLHRAVAEQNTTGKARIYLRNHHVLGVSLIGSGATELISAFALVIQGKLSLKHILDTIYPYPTYSEISKKLASLYYSQLDNSLLWRPIIRWMNRVLP